MTVQALIEPMQEVLRGQISGRMSPDNRSASSRQDGVHMGDGVQRRDTLFAVANHRRLPAAGHQSEEVRQMR